MKKVCLQLHREQKRNYKMVWVIQSRSRKPVTIEIGDRGNIVYIQGDTILYWKDERELAREGGRE